MKCTSCKARGLCPVSFGLALGIVTGFSMFVFSVWMMYQGIPAPLAGQVPPITWGSAIVQGLIGILEGFIFGFFVALLYDAFSCCCKQKCCHPEGAECRCGCHDKTAIPPKKV